MSDRGKIALVGALDTKGAEYAYIDQRVRAGGWETVIVDVGVLGTPRCEADISRETVAVAGGTSLAALQAQRDRGAAIRAMGHGAGTVINACHRENRLAGALVLGGSGAAAVAAHALSSLPLGVPKVIVSTVVAGDTRPFIGDSDFTLIYPVVDIAGINRISRRVLDNAAGAIMGMAEAHWRSQPDGGDRPAVGLTMFGITTPCVDRVRRQLLEAGYEPLVFSANGVGGRSMERLLDDRELIGAIDVTTTELADRLVGGILPAAEGRLEAAGRHALPQVVSVGALDVVNFGPAVTVPEKYRGRRLYRHNDAVTLMRTTAEESAQLGDELARRVSAGAGRRAVVLPLRGISALSVKGGPFHDPEADAALFGAIRKRLSADVDLIEFDADINDPAFADVLVASFAAACRPTNEEAVAT